MILFSWQSLGGLKSSGKTLQPVYEKSLAYSPQNRNVLFAHESPNMAESNVGEVASKKTYEELERENKELRARLEKSERIVRTIGQLRGMLKTLNGQLNESSLKV